MANDFFSSYACTHRRSCKACRTQSVYQRHLRARYNLPIGFDCPYGITADKFSQSESQPISEDKYNLRLSICAACPDQAYEAALGQCRLCGCQVRDKALVEDETCPLRYWELTSVPNRTSVPVASKERPVNSKKRLTGDLILKKELDLRSILPPTGETAQAFNAFHLAELDPTGCRGCKRNKHMVAITRALETEFSKLPENIQLCLSVMFGDEYRLGKSR